MNSCLPLDKLPPSNFAGNLENSINPISASISRGRWNTSLWINYARWEESQQDFNRARSQTERVLEAHYRDQSTLLKYAEFEMRNGFINHARNMEEMVLMGWQSDLQGWLPYIMRFELRYNEVERARVIFERFVKCHPKATSWIKFAEFEVKNGEISWARNYFERAVDKSRKIRMWRGKGVYISLRLIMLPKGGPRSCVGSLLLLRKLYGDKEWIEDGVVGKRRFEYEDEVRKNYLNYNAGFDYMRLEAWFEDSAETETTRPSRHRLDLNIKYFKNSRFVETATDMPRPIELERFMSKQLPLRHIETEDGPMVQQCMRNTLTIYLFPEETQCKNLKIIEAAYKWKKPKNQSKPKISSVFSILISNAMLLFCKF
ncbi:unnamed protein product [Coffea canephora]|uniref:Suppressor of forked domain-containing protein n=1 Tax=Coffea canephora TaxID=49390 RepID=A0A068U766_COFCA|nr:unnamed protein product [Coffea canephora]